MNFSRLRGTHDILGDEALQFETLTQKAREVFRSFGFSELSTPILESKEVFTRALGDQTDVVQKEMYEFKDRSGEWVAMRPEGTAGIVRAYLENHLDKTMGLAKLFYIGAMFRSERPQAGRLRQFHQAGVEILGTGSPLADAETIHCLSVFLDAVGISGYALKLNNLGDFKERTAFGEVLKTYFKPLEKDLCEDCRIRLAKNVFRLLDCKNAACRALVKKSPSISAHLGAESKTHFEKVQKILSAAGVLFELDPTMVRGLDYYTKTVFEVSHPLLGSQDAVAAGGRYDRLIETFGGSQNAGAVGFAVGIERLILCLKPGPPTDERENSFFVAALGDAAQGEGFRLVSSLRAEGVKALMDFEGKSLKSQMRSADKHRCRYVIILGDDEIQKKSLTLKDMENGEQSALDLSGAVEALKKKISK